jgi:Sec7-like guanine-nucleotide exchange factor
MGVLTPEQTMGERALVLGNFLRNTSNLEKEKIGEFIGHGDDEQSEAIRTAYVSTFNVEGRSVVSSLRMFLGQFRLPGEAQQIDRILQTFARKVFESSGDKDLLATDDVAYLLSFSIIMLNTGNMTSHFHCSISYTNIYLRF